MSGLNRRGSNEVWPEFIAMLMKKPMTIRALAEVTGGKPNNISRRLKGLRSEGVVYIKEYEVLPGSVAAVWAMQPSILFYEDAQRPAVKPRWIPKRRAVEVRA